MKLAVVADALNRWWPGCFFEPKAPPEVAGFQAGWTCCVGCVGCPREERLGLVCPECAERCEAVLPQYVIDSYTQHCRMREHKRDQQREQ